MIISHDNVPLGELEMLIDTDKRVIVLQNDLLYVTLEQSDRSWIDYYPDGGTTNHIYRYLVDIWNIKGVSYHGPIMTRPNDINVIMSMVSNGHFTPRTSNEFAALAYAHGSRLEIDTDETGLQSKN